MSKNFTFKCDICSKTELAKWNREHWLPPEDWHEVTTVGGVFVGHICGSCWKGFITKKVKESKKKGGPKRAF